MSETPVKAMTPEPLEGALTGADDRILRQHPATSFKRRLKPVFETRIHRTSIPVRKNRVLARKFEGGRDGEARDFAQDRQDGAAP